MDNMENMDFEAMRDKQADELMQLLDERRMKEGFSSALRT